MTVNPKLKKTFESIMENDIETARSLFREVVIEMSKDIYNTFESEDNDFDFKFDDETLDPGFDDEDVDIEAIARKLSEDGEEELELELDTAPEGGELEANDIEASDDFETSLGGDEEGEGDLETRIEDIEDAFEALKAEFDAIVGGEVDGESGEDEVTDLSVSDLDVDGAEGEGEEVVSDEETFSA